MNQSLDPYDLKHCFRMDSLTSHMEGVLWVGDPPGSIDGLALVAETEPCSFQLLLGVNHEGK